MRKKLLDCLCVLLAALFPLAAAAAQAPVLHTRGYYMNDYASVIFDSHRQEILQASGDLDEATGIQVVVLTVESLGEYSLPEYGEAIFDGWGIGGTGGNGVLILASAGDKAAQVLVGDGLPELAAYRDAAISFLDGNLSLEIMRVYRPLMLDAYGIRGVEPPAGIRELLGAEVPRQRRGPLTGGTAILVAAVALVVGRSYRTSRKYRAKYLKGHVRKRKDYTRTYDEEKQYQDEGETIYSIDRDDEGY